MPDLSGARVLITGANGFIGSHTVLYFENQGARVVPVDVSPRSPDLSLLPIVTPSVLFDISDFGKFSDHCKRESVTHIVHLAYPTREETTQALDFLLQGTRTVLESAKASAMQRVVFSSSGAIYGRLRKADQTPIREDDPVQIFPTFLYRSAKMLGEWLGDFYETQHGVSFVALRFSAVYGQGQWFGIGDQLKQGVLGKPCRPTLTRGPTDDPIHVTDIARAVFLACFRDKVASRSYNIASDVPYNNEQLFAAIRKALPGVAFDASANSETDNYHRQRDPLDMTLAKNELGFVPEYDLERGIAITAAWLTENKSRLS